MIDSEWRCGKCGRLLCTGRPKDVTIKCPRCGTYNHLRAGSPSGEPPDGQKPEKENEEG